MERLDLPSNYPGIQGVGFTRRLAPDEWAALPDRLRADGLDGVSVRPLDPRDEHHAIVYLEPLDRRNLAAIGYDMYSEPVRRRAMARARDEGTAALSGAVTLVQEIDERKQAGFLIYVPVFAGGAVPPTVEARRAALVGFSYSPFRADDLFLGIFGAERPRVAFLVHDGETDALIHDSRVHGLTPSGHAPAHRTRRSTVVAGHPWTLVFESVPEFEAASGRGLAPTLLALGSVLSAALFAITRRSVSARAEAEQRAAAARMEAEERRRAQGRTRAIVDAAPDAVVAMDRRGLITEFNPAAERTFGWRRDEAVGRPLADLLVPPRWRGEHEAAVARHLRGGQGGPAGRRLELEALRRDGGEVPVEVTIVHLPADETGPSFTAFLRDITERARIEQERRDLLAREQAARREAEAASRAKDDFLAVLSHELRTPLSAILGWAQLLERDPADPERVRRAAEVVARNARAQARLVDDILDVSRIVSGKLQLHLGRLDDVSPVVAAAVEALRPQAEARGVALEARLGPGPGPVTCDPGRLEQVAWNLLSNAIKFTPSGGRVEVRCERDGERLRLVVRDTGKGIAADFLPHAFEPFRQEDASARRAHGGLGLGLALVRHLTALHGGEVQVESPGPGQGSTFTVLLPLAPADDAAAPAAPEGDAASTLAGAAVLLVEDDADTREVLVEVLTGAGATVRAVCTAAGALAALDEAAPDLLISDIGLPGEDGYALLRRVRTLPRGGDIPAIALTAFAGPDDRRRSREAGFDAHLAKPVTPHDLVAAASQARRQGVSGRLPPRPA